MPDTDGDGVSDGDEVLVEGTDPLVDDVCRPVEEVCNGQMMIVMGGPTKILIACYGGPPGTLGPGLRVG